MRESTLSRHLQVPLCFPPNSLGQTDSDPEDGISSDTDGLLRERKSGSKIDNWDSLWRILFPKDMTVPSQCKSQSKTETTRSAVESPTLLTIDSVVC